jgi:porin
MRRDNVHLLLLLSLLTPCRAAVSAGAGPTDANVTAVAGEPETLTGGLWGLSDRLADHGMKITLGSTNVYQANVKGGLDTHRHAGRFTGSYDVEMAADLEKSLGLMGLGLLVHGWGGYPATKGINDTMAGSAFNVNWDAIGDRSFDVVEVILEWKPMQDRLAVQAGKINFARVFDTSAYANDETSQFLNGAFINNPTIPIPDYCLGITAAFNVTDAWSVAVGAGDAEADGMTSGFDTAFDGDDHFFYDAEASYRAEWPSPRGPLAGNYHAGFWYAPQPRANSDSDRKYGDDRGFYLGMDQMLLRESDDPQDSQGLGLFGRYGCTDKKRNDVTDFWSVGLQYQGLWPGRDDDVTAIGFAQGFFSRDASGTFPERSEQVIEAYYNTQLTKWLHVSPAVQYLADPGGAHDDAIVLGVRAQVTF